MQPIFILVCILAVCIIMLPKLVQARVWALRKMHLFKLADWHERNQSVIVQVARIVLVVLILVLLLFMAGNQFIVMEELLAAFQKEFPDVQKIFYETLPPGLELKQILAGGAIFRMESIWLDPKKQQLT